MNEHIRKVCKMGIKGEVCPYLGMGSHGFVCMKTYTNLIHKHKMGPEGLKVALGGNCKGASHEEMNKK
jgi:hypothetical protein